jgi:8-oxo-dGTP pyrophosphatase MutT (NUDIX family)
MLREISAGGVVVRPTGKGWEVVVIEPQREDSGPVKMGKSDKKRQKSVLALPKGLVDAGEKPEQTALREIGEEAGVSGTVLSKLTDIKYAYVRSWSDNQRVFKIVSFYLVLYREGKIDDIAEDMRIEVKRALWIPLAGAQSKLTYRGEREVIQLAQKYLTSHALEPDPQEAH